MIITVLTFILRHALDVSYTVSNVNFKTTLTDRSPFLVKGAEFGDSPKVIVFVDVSPVTAGPFVTVRPMLSNLAAPNPQGMVRTLQRQSELRPLK